VTPRVVCDTNVLVSAFIAGGPPSRVVESAIDGRLRLVLAEPVLVELERILIVRLGFERDRVEAILALLDELAEERVGTPSGLVEPVTGDPDDDVILACAVEAGVHALVSGDRRHLLPVGEHEGVRILTAQELLAELSAG
jgi:putative PIN family toxin of toxin-antitoxin system